VCDIDAVNRCEIDTGDAFQFRRQVELRRIGGCGAALFAWLGGGKSWNFNAAI